jgi:hypothetical protein
MAQRWRNWGFVFAGWFAIAGAILFEFRVLAQNIILDGSLGPAATLTGPNYSIR